MSSTLGDRPDPRTATRAAARDAAHRQPTSLARALARAEARALLTCAGQGVAWLPELATMADEPGVGALIDAADEVLREVADTREARWSGLYADGFALRRWLAGAAPDARRLDASPLSMPGIFVTQLARFVSVARRGLGAAFEAGAIAGVSGYSQGLAAATLIAERRDAVVPVERFAEYLRALAWLGFDATMATREAGARGTEPSPMVLVTGPESAAIEAALVEGAFVALKNDRKRTVLAGTSEALAAVRARLERRAQREAEERKAGVRGGRPMTLSWEPIATTAAFHSPLTAAGLARTLERVAGFSPAPVLTVYDPGAGSHSAQESSAPRMLAHEPSAERMLAHEPSAERLLASIAVRPGRWQAMLGAAANGVDAVLDLGPEAGIARLTAGAVRGLGVEVVALADDHERERFFSAPRAARPVRYDDFAPRLAQLPTGAIVIDNAFSRATGTPPVILPGMTPTTVDVPIVAAAANAGYTAELAGGGQVTEAIFESRVAELKETLAPGVEVVFNALLLDAYLWGLHLGDKRLVQRARAAGAPLAGVTISAGIPAVEDAVRLLDELAALGMRTNAFKPGTKQQIAEVVAIAGAARQHTIFIHIEGGKAGGHHSWEDLEELLLESYHAIRTQPNLVLCVGGGIADEARAVELLMGTWSARHGLSPMPVDAVFLGTLAMACREASATAGVKAALAAAVGTAGEADPNARWVGRGRVAGGVTSGRSQLDADIHYLDNAAARCGRLLDEVAGDAAQVAARREEIIAALATTAKPYFGDVEAMTYAEVLARLVELMAIGGASPRYEDGPWLDATWRLRVFDWVRRAEARLAGAAGLDEVASVVPDRTALDQPDAVLAALCTAHPRATNERVHPVDATWFVRELCARPGKPVPFVPVIDQDVRRHFKADSLWQAQHPRYAADACLVIPGPEAVSGIARADEPVAALLARFERAVIEALQRGGAVARATDALRARGREDVPAGVSLGGTADHLVLRIDQAAAAIDLRGWIAGRYHGPLADLVGRAEADGLACADGRVDNPIPRLLTPIEGATLTLRTGAQGALAHVLYQPGDDEWVALDETREGISVRLGWGDKTAWQLAIAVEPAAHPRFVVAAGAVEAAVRELYARTLFPAAGAAVEPFAVARETVALPAEIVTAYQRVTGREEPDAAPALAQVFSLAWPVIHRTLSCDALGGGLLRLVHRDVHVTRLASAWGRGEIEVEARVTRIEDAADHRLVTVVAGLAAGGRELARLETRFHIRGAFAPAVEAHETLDVSVVVDAAGAAFIAGHDGVSCDASGPGRVRIVAELIEVRRGTRRRYEARGRIEGAVSGNIAMANDGAAEHPLRALCAVLGAGERGERAERATPKRTLARGEARAPASMSTFAEVGGDHNPIHTRWTAARLAGLAEPIAHGMWTAARLEAFVVEACGGAERLSAIEVAFTAPVLPGEALNMTAARVALSDIAQGRPAGAQLIEAVAKVARGGIVATARVWVAPPKTAYVFPGQGIQQRDMGMAALLRSAAARKVWERADAFTREALGFSILRVVRENPRELMALGRSYDAATRERLVHPQGVLHLTQLTQVAMAVLACAQVAELREAGAWREGAFLAGHSVGEYNALCAGAGILPLEAVVAIVYQRGRVMHGLVPRDAHGESGYRMGVIRPHLAGLDHAGAERVVAEVAARTGGFLEIVNYNVRGRQYSVTGHADALVALERALTARQAVGDKPAYVEVPGIDVPFHSRALRGGVADFRAALERHLPAVIDAAPLVGRYVPNLVAIPFASTREFALAVRAAVGEPMPALDDLIAHFDARLAADRNAATRLVLIELLAWQFASPVRWIETQDVLLTAAAELIEVGVGYQPTLANMARQTLQRAGQLAQRVVVMNVEAERAAVFAEDADPALVEPEPVVATSVAPAEAAAPVATIAAPVSAPAPTPTATAAPVDAPLTHAEALVSIVALQTKNRPAQVGPAETIDGLFDGVSSRRNQVLMDIGAEFDAGSIDRAHEIPIAELAKELAARAPAWRAPGAYLAAAHGEALKRVFARSGLGAREAAAHLEATFGFGPGLVTATFDVIALETRAGASSRGGELGGLALPGDAAPASKADAKALLERAAEALGQRRGTTYGRLGATTANVSAAVDSRALGALEERLFGGSGAFLDAARAFARAAGKDLDAVMTDRGDGERARLEAIVRELGDDFLTLVEPRFDAHRHVAFTSSWASAQRDLVRLAYDALNGRVDAAHVERELARLARHAGPRLAATARWFARQAGQSPLAAAFTRFADAPATPSRFGGRVALVTGASPGSIALEVARDLLAGGAIVVVTTTQPSRDRLAFYRRVYDDAAAPGAELHVVPANAASFQDLDALVDWLFRAETEQAGATTRVLKPALVPDLIVPFAALKDAGTADQLGGTAEASLRAMVLGVERLVATVARRLVASGDARRCHVLLPLSPNHGAFGGDGAYAESKAALEVLLAKWTSERQAWARATTMVGARIGWVRGTGLMAHNDAVAPGLEAATGIRTWSSRDMGAALADLLTDEARAAVADGPTIVDLAGGFERVPDLKGAVDRVRREAADAARTEAGLQALRAAEQMRLAPAAAATTVRALPAWPAPDTSHPSSRPWPGEVSAALDELVVIVGFGEIGPGGSARTRFELEVADRLSAPAVLELAWLTGLVRWEATGKGGRWVDVASGEAVAEADLAARYHDEVRGRVGVRFIDPAVVGFDAERSPVYEKVFLERDFSFVVASEDEARAFAASDPERTVITPDAAPAWRVTRKAGSELRVPREVRLSRRVAGQLPTGMTLARYGFPGEMLAAVDPVALMNLAATVEAFVAAGTTPEELLAWVHPARVATTQGSGMGGMRSLHRLYVDHLLGRERQSDILQETLINVVFAYATSAYVGSYGPMSHPVAACATAALSLEDALDKIMLGKADVVIAGGWDDLSAEGVIGFGDMSATADTDKMLAMGLAPDQMSRANDRRRRGFVESQGGGAFLLARGDVAAKMGLPVYGVLGYAASFGDGINRSIPAPGIGSLGAVLGGHRGQPSGPSGHGQPSGPSGQRSPLGKALARLGLTADDIAVVSKHDTSTQANDPNESGIHQAIQDALGRTPGNPLLVVSQKTVLGHAKGGAAAWQTIGLCQMLAAGRVPGNRNLDAVDPALEAHTHLTYTSLPLAPGPALPMRAGLATSLGFGHVSALLLIVHADAFERALPPEDRAAWRARAEARKADGRRRWTDAILGRAPLYEKRTERRFAAADGTDAQRQEETMMLLDPDARYDAARGCFVRPSGGAS